VTQRSLVTDRHISYQTFCHIAIAHVCCAVLLVAEDVVFNFGIICTV